MNLSHKRLKWGGAYENNFWVYWWNILPKGKRYFGYVQDWHDGPISSFGWWFGNISWRLPWTDHAGGIR